MFVWFLFWGTAGLFDPVLAQGPGIADEESNEYLRPILRYDTPAHHAPVSALAFDAEGRLLSAGYDKVVKVWRVTGSGADRALEPLVTLRPPILNRGSRGEVRVMALSPRGDLLALAGTGVTSRAGEILLFAYPVRPDREPTGRLVTTLPAVLRGEAEDQHTKAVTALAFSPDGSYLISSGFDRTVRVWRVVGPDGQVPAPGSQMAARYRSKAVVTSLATFRGPDDAQLLAGDEAGLVGRFRIDPRGRLRRLGQLDTTTEKGVEARDEIGRAVSALTTRARHDGENWPTIVGREDGALIAFDARDFDVSWKLPGGNHGRIDAARLSPDGTRLAVSWATEPFLDATKRPDSRRTVVLLDMSDGQELRQLRRENDAVLALAFAPDGRLAIGGGDRQELTLVEGLVPAAPNAPLQDLRVVGVRDRAVRQGSTVWDIGFAPVGLQLVLTRKGPNGADQIQTYDVIRRQTGNEEPADVRRALREFDGWSVRPVDQLRLQVVRAGRVESTLALDQRIDRRWYAYSFLPGNAEAGHPRLVLAVAAGSGVILFDPENGERIRHFSGHDGDITYNLAPSPDGRWLATVGPDQTVRLFALKGCDVRPKLGATIERRPDGRYAVASVEANSFATTAGLKAGMIIERVLVARTDKLEPDQFDPGTFFENREALDAIDRKEPGPGRAIALQIQGEAVNRGSTRRDRPVLSLYLSVDGQWVAWMLAGYYDTSIEGDARFLGWHRNRGDLVDGFGSTEYIPIRQFAAIFNKPEVIDALIFSGGDVGAALQLGQAQGSGIDPNDPTGTAVAQVEQYLPPRFDWVDPPAPDAVVVDDEVTLRFAPEPDRNVRDGAQCRFTLIVNDKVQGDEELEADDLVGQIREIPVRLEEGPNKVVLQFRTTESYGDPLDPTLLRQYEPLELMLVKASPPERVVVPTLAARTLGVSRFAAEPRYALPFADADARDLAEDIFGGRAVTERYDPERVQVASASSIEGGLDVEQLRNTLDGLRDDLDAGRLNQGGSVFLYVRSHLMLHQGRLYWIATDSPLNDPESTSVTLADPFRTVPITEVTDLLDRLVFEGGQRVVLMMDGWQDRNPQSGSRELRDARKDWIRSLLYDHNVVVAAASHDRPAPPSVRDDHSLFALGLLDALGSAPPLSEGVPSLRSYLDAMSTRVYSSSDGQQEPFFGIPDGLDGNAPLFDGRPSAVPADQPSRIAARVESR